MQENSGLDASGSIEKIKNKLEHEVPRKHKLKMQVITSQYGSAGKPHHARKTQVKLIDRDCTTPPPQGKKKKKTKANTRKGGEKKEPEGENQRSTPKGNKPRPIKTSFWSTQEWNPSNI